MNMMVESSISYVTSAGEHDKSEGEQQPSFDDGCHMGCSTMTSVCYAVHTVPAVRSYVRRFSEILH
jgi:hypothetical protein